MQTHDSLSAIPQRMLIVTIHDVAPPFTPGVRELLGELDRRAISPRVLKVVPNYADRWPLERDADLCDLLRSEVAAGSEIVAHGWTHQTQGVLHGSLTQRWRGAWFAPRAAEFLTLSEDAAHESALSARRGLADALGVEPEAFCAPAWLINREGRQGVAAAGFRYLIEQAKVRDIQSGQAITTPWQGYMGVGGIHELLVQLGNGAVAASSQLTGGGLSHSPVVKVFLHPQRLQDSPALERVLDRLTELAARRELVTVNQLFATHQRHDRQLVARTRPAARDRQPLVSVVIPARNEQSYITRALESVAGQRYPLDRVQCVVVDNDSRDGTAGVVLELAERWAAGTAVKPMLQLERESRQGTARAKNRGAMAADGDVIVFLDADSTLGTTVIGDVAAVWRAGARGGSIPVLAESDDFFEKGFFYTLEFGKRIFGIHSQMFYIDRQLFSLLGGFNDDLHLAEDLDLMRRAADSLRSGDGRLQRIGRAHFGSRSRNGTYIYTSPRRFRTLPWRFGMIWMFVRWALGFLGIGRRRYAAGGTMPEPLPHSVRLARRLAGAGMRLVLSTVGPHEPGEPAGLLWIWWAWERIYTRWYRLRPVRPGGILLYRLEVHKRPRSVTLPDGTRIASGDIICRIHLRNSVLGQLGDSVTSRRIWQVIKAFRGDLAVLAQQGVDGTLGLNGRPAKALTSETLLFRIARRLGFAVWARPQSWRREFDRQYMRGMLALYHPDGADRLGQNTAQRTRGQPDLATADQRDPIFPVGEIWMSRATLLDRYLPEGNSRAPVTDN